MTKQIKVSYNGVVKTFFITTWHVSFLVQKKLQELGFERRFAIWKFHTDDFSKVETIYNTLKPLGMEFTFYLDLPETWGKKVTWEEFKDFFTKKHK